MNIVKVEKIANAVLYEGYVLYPYRPSALKNRQRFNFGVLYPRSHCNSEGGTEIDQTVTECLVVGSAHTSVEAKLRFLQMAARSQWQEGEERQVCLPLGALCSLVEKPCRVCFELAGGQDAEGRKSECIEGELELRAVQLNETLFKLSLLVTNVTAQSDAVPLSRDEALLQSLVSAHSIIRVEHGEFVSLLDPPSEYRQAVSQCRNVGTWPVLAGDEPRRDLMLSAPIILYDYPQIAPESTGDLCDGLEIDEILALRVLTLTEAEKQEVRSGDERARRILERTEMMPVEHFQKLHGAMRGLSRPQSTTNERREGKV